MFKVVNDLHKVIPWKSVIEQDQVPIFMTSPLQNLNNMTVAC